ncbi:E1 ubiquitin-activating protein [Glugoides intestinalis]
MDYQKNNEDSLVDEELYSRQLYVMGHEAMHKLMATKVLLIGLDGLGQEIAKNICLAGIRHVSLYDKTEVTVQSLGAGFYFSKSDIGKTKDISVLKRLSQLNKYVEVRVVEDINLEEYSIVVSVNQNIEYNIQISEECHEKGIKFIMANASGLFTQIFCDFQNYMCIDKNGEVAISGVINDITTDGILTVIEGPGHSLDSGDTVMIEDKSYKIKVINRVQFKLDGYESEAMKIGGDYEQVKQPFEIKHKSLREAILKAEIMDFDFCDPKKPGVIHDLFIKGETEEREEKYKSIERQFNKTKGCLITPICSILGGFAAQEALKAASCKFVPVQQFYYFDAIEAFIESNNEEEEFQESRYADMVKLFGVKGFSKIKAMKIFLVGAGAIGCENLKNFVCSGLGMNGKISVTDMDSIEQSNLNRQFLFRAEDVSKMKSASAVQRVKELNEDFIPERKEKHDRPFTDTNIERELKEVRLSGNIISYTSAVNKESEKQFTDRFISEYDIISNALDNVEARAYMDQRCIQLRKPMVDAGTLGTKGHVQVVIPFVSESYSSSTDPQEKSIPLCTIKSYPYVIEHVIEWAMGEFRQHFNENVNDVKEYMKSKDPGLEEVFNLAPNNVEACLKRGLGLFVSNFSTSIQKLLSTFPPDHIDDEGNLFWSPPKKIPTSISFNINDAMHITFVHSSANLFAECFGIRKISEDEVYAFLENILSLKEPNPICFEDTEVDFNVVYPLEFDKDTWHTDFIYAAANLRARNYNIGEKTKHFIKGIAGRIIPAIATTTAIVSGLATLEILKYATREEKEVNEDMISDNSEMNAKNTYLDLAAPFLASTELVKPKERFYESCGEKIRYTIWTRLEIKDDFLSNIIKKIEKEIGDEVSMISIGNKMIYWKDSTRYDVNLDKTISELCKKLPGQQICYIDVLPENTDEMADVAIIFED